MTRPTTLVLVTRDCYRTVDMPPDVTVRFGDDEIFIRRGTTKIVQWNGGYEIVRHGVDPRSARERIAAFLRRTADRVAGVR